jgi:hypothetical protein
MGDRTTFENKEGLQECNKSDLLRPTSVLESLANFSTWVVKALVYHPGANQE